jgi:arylsulfatase A-like enzyme
VVTGRWNPYQNVATTLGEAVRASGRQTTFVVPREVLRYVGDVLLGRGIDRVDRIVTDREKRDVADVLSAPLTTDRTLAAIAAAGDKPFLVWAHYFDLHEHHQLPVDDAAIGKLAVRGETAVGDRYRALLARVDGEVGRLLDAVPQDTIVVLFSDHGESLGEDPRLPDNHGTVAYQALVHVPIAIRIPGVAASRIAETVGLVDLPPTLLGLLGIDGAMGPLDGADLAPFFLGAPPALQPTGRAFVIHESEQRAVVEWPYKLLLRPADNVIELYDLSRDPREQRDLSASSPDVVEKLRARLGTFPDVPLDRTPKGRQWREDKSRPPKP